MAKIYIDENLSPVVLQPLVQLMRHGNVFRTPAMENLLGAKDVELFEHLRLLEYDVIATLDRKQLDNDEERNALRESRLHWIGLADPRLSGLDQMAAESAALLLVLPRILTSLPAEPTVFHVDTIAMRHGASIVSEPA